MALDKDVADSPSAGLGRGRKIANELETVGVLPVPDDQRVMRPHQLFIVWLMASASATTPLIGHILYPYGPWLAIAAIVMAFIIGMVPAGYFSEMGREVPLTALVVARKTFGWHGSSVFSLLFTLVNLGWFGLNTAVGASILAAVTHSPDIMWDVVVGLIQIVLVIFGMKWLERFYRYTTLVLIICYVGLVAYMFLHFPVHIAAQTQPVNWGQTISVVLSFSLLSWAYKLSTVSRFGVPSTSTNGSRPAYFFAGSTGIMTAVLVMGVLGIFSQYATGNWDIALIGGTIGGWGWIAAFGVALAVLHTNAMNLYPSVIDLLVAMDNVKTIGRKAQPAATVALGIVGIALAAVGILDKVQSFLNAAGDAISPFTFVMLADWLFIQRRKTSAAEFAEKPSSLTQQWNVLAVVAFLIGFVVNFWGQSFLPGFCYNILPLPVVGGVLAAILYTACALARPGHRRQG